MGVLSFWSLFRSPSAVKFSSFHKAICMADEVSISKHHMVNHLDIFSGKRFPRRLFSQFIGSYPILLYANPSFGAPMMDVQEPEIVRYIIEGLKEVLVGMRVGGIFGPRRSLLSHRNEPLIFEVQLLKVQ
ncbi:Peptidyl-prolyl cis-trans isomerase FKBP16-1, chloroplastic [Cucurbita argyrosperma subsp. argyrosperma]|nr:Peptidyl-prolyl cis-trans isomerase FKBP16-1, chloroplastic [Cucurbita argyrosperma subsp. argyrosperma]